MMSRIYSNHPSEMKIVGNLLVRDRSGFNSRFGLVSTMVPFDALTYIATSSSHCPREPTDSHDFHCSPGYGRKIRDWVEIREWAEIRDWGKIG